MAKKKNKSRNIAFIIAVIVVIIGLVVAIILKKDKGVVISTGSPSIATLVETIPANGKIQPVTEVKISPDVSGEIIELNFEEGDYVKKGDLIIKIKQDVYISLKERAIASLNSSKAQLLQQEAQLRQAELNYNRNKILFAQRAISESEYEGFLSQYEIAKEQVKASQYNVESAGASLREAEENLTKTIIYAPMDGIISKLMVEKGERVVGTSQMAGTEMLRIANFDKMEVLVDVNENDIIRLKNLDTAAIDVDAFPGREFKGVVTQIANSAKNIGSTADQVTNFEVKVYILPESYQDLLTTNPIPFRPGMSASVMIQTNKVENALTVPIQCITTRQELGDSVTTSIPEFIFVFDKETSTVKPVQVTTGIQDINNIQILTGLKEEDTIVTGPYNAIVKTLGKGTKVELGK